MKKRSFVLVLAALMICMALGSTAFAAVTGPELAQNPARQRGIAIVEEANAQIAQVVREAQQSKFPCTDLLISYTVARTDAIAKTAITRAAFYGVTVVCEYETVIIRGQEVLIDPLKVVTV